jgi:hypothetical protein
MRYRHRFIFAALCSCGINLFVLMLPWPHAAVVDGARRPPLVFDFLPAAEPEPARETVPQVVETRTTEQTPGPDTPLISDRDSAAADEETYDGEDPAPRLEEQDGLYELPAPPAPPEPVVPPPATGRETPEPPPVADKDDLLAMAQPEMAAPPAPQAIRESAPPPEPSAPSPPAPLSPSRGRGSLEGMAVEEGIASFAALRDDVAAYVLEIKPLVQREWLALLLTRYSGTSPTQAVVRLAIAPDGAIAGVEQAETPRDRIYAALCQEAIRRAGPFKPFPFRIPREYRGQNLVIRWTFRFL